MSIFNNKYLIKILLSFLCQFLFINAFSNPVRPHSSIPISYTDIGQGKPLVLIHAFPADLRLWYPQMLLQTHFRVIALDLWGFGNASPADGQSISMDDFANEVKELLDQLKVDKAIIAGESMGGYVALSFAQHYPDRVNGLILSGTQSIADNTETKLKREAIALDVLNNGPRNFTNQFLPKALSPNAPEDLKVFLQNILESQSALAIASASRGMALRQDTSRVLEQLAIPILIIAGEQDVVINPDQSHYMHSLAKYSRLIIVKKAGHLVSLEQSDQWNEAVLDMFK